MSIFYSVTYSVSTHSRPKAAASQDLIKSICYGVSTHSRPKAAAESSPGKDIVDIVSTHSRPKAAAAVHQQQTKKSGSFNTQPPEGGC